VNFTTDWAQVHVDADSNPQEDKIAPGGFAWLSALMTLTSNRSLFFPREGPTGERYTFLRSSCRCDSDDWPVIFGKHENEFR